MAINKMVEIPVGPNRVSIDVQFKNIRLVILIQNYKVKKKKEKNRKLLLFIKE